MKYGGVELPDPVRLTIGHDVGGLGPFWRAYVTFEGGASTSVLFLPGEDLDRYELPRMLGQYADGDAQSGYACAAYICAYQQVDALVNGAIRIMMDREKQWVPIIAPPVGPKRISSNGATLQPLNDEEEDQQ